MVDKCLIDDFKDILEEIDAPYLASKKEKLIYPINVNQCSKPRSNNPWQWFSWLENKERLKKKEAFYVTDSMGQAFTMDDSFGLSYVRNFPYAINVHFCIDGRFISIARCGGKMYLPNEKTYKLSLMKFKNVNSFLDYVLRNAEIIKPTGYTMLSILEKRRDYLNSRRYKVFKFIKSKIPVSILALAENMGNRFRKNLRGCKCETYQDLWGATHSQDFWVLPYFLYNYIKHQWSITDTPEKEIFVLFAFPVYATLITCIILLLR